MNKSSLIFVFLIFPVFTSGRVIGAIVVDGVLDEPEWEGAQVFEKFLVTRPYSLKQPEYNTRVLFTYTKQGVYVGFVNQQPALESPPQTTLRDQDIQTDYNEIILDFDGKGIGAFGFKIGRNGSIQDSVWSNENIESTDWDGDWLRAVSEQKDDWVSEFFVPWSLFPKGKPDEEHDIGIYFGRVLHDRDTRFSFPDIDRHQKSFISRFSTLGVIATPANSVDIFPYARSTYDTLEQKAEYRAGVDLFWRPGSSQQLNVSINPDYGQVEADDLIVNFSAIEDFFEEKRPFFRENHDLFDIRGPETFRAVHTPRIGGQPDAGEKDSNDVRAAARYQFVGENIDFGVLVASENDVRDSEGRDYLAVRSRYRWDNASAGFLHAATERPELGRTAKVSLLDYQIDPLENLRIEGMFIQSKVDDKQLPSVKDNGWVLSAQWESTPVWLHELVLFDYGDQLQLNDLGFVKRIDRKQLEYETTLEIPDFSAADILRDAEITFEYQWKTNHESDALPLEWGVGFEATTASASSWSIGYAYVGDGLDDIITEGNGNLFFPSFSTFELGYESPPSSIFRFAWGFEVGESGYYGQRYQVEFAPSIQLGSRINLDLNFSYELNDSWVIWADDEGLGEYDLEEFTVALNTNFVPAPSHEIRLKLEMATVSAQGLRSITNLPGEDPGFLTESPLDFSESEFAVQLRYRYEISALSEVFVVYSRGGLYETNKRADDIPPLLSRSINSNDSETILFKIKLHF